MNTILTVRISRFSMIAIIALGMLLCIGCDSVTITEPIGKPLSTEDAQALAGIYKNFDDERTVELRHVAENHLRLGGLVWEEETHTFEAKHIDLYIGVLDAFMVVNLMPTDDPDQNYSFLLLKETHQGLVVWGANVPMFAKAVEAGTLSGDVKQGEHNTTHVTLTDADQVASYLDNKPLAEYFQWDEPTFLHRVAKD